jgi:hypothetical protein
MCRRERSLALAVERSLALAVERSLMLAVKQLRGGWRYSFG